MGKGKFLALLGGVVALGLVGYAAAQDECSYSPSGSLDVRLVVEGIRHQLDEEAECDPWAIVQPDRSVSSVRVIPYSNWTDAPARPVEIRADGTITILEPLDKTGEKTRILTRAKDPPLAEQLLDDLRRFTRFNRLTMEDLDRFVEKLPDDADLADARTYMVAPTTRCWSALYDGGGVRLEYVDGQGRRRTSFLDSYCNSPSMSRAIATAYDARERAFERTGFTGEHFADHLATF